MTVALACGVSVCAAVGQGDAAQSPEGASLEGSLTAIRTAFLQNDPTELARRFPRHIPVYVRVPPLEGGGFLGPGPLKAFLERMVAERASVDFELPASAASASPDSGQRRAVYVKAKWTYRPAGSATLQVDYLHLALRYVPEHAEWQIVEVKTSAR